MNNSLKVSALVALLLSLASCQSTTVLLANFNAEPAGAPPAPNQPTGTTQFLDGGSGGSVRVAPSPDPAVKNNGCLITHPTSNADQTILRAQFASFPGPGKYGLLAAVFIPSGTGAVTLSLESFNGSINQPLEFLHLDFMPQNNVRINDVDADRFGTFPRDRTFVVSITVDTTASPFKATISLTGAGGTASGSKDVTLPSLAAQFGAVRFFMGFPHTGSFFFDDVLVTRRNS